MGVRDLCQLFPQLNLLAWRRASPSFSLLVERLCQLAVFPCHLPQGTQLTAQLVRASFEISNGLTQAPMLPAALLDPEIPLLDVAGVLDWPRESVHFAHAMWRAAIRSLLLPGHAMQAAGDLTESFMTIGESDSLLVTPPGKPHQLRWFGFLLAGGITCAANPPCFSVTPPEIASSLSVLAFPSPLSFMSSGILSKFSGFYNQRSLQESLYTMRCDCGVLAHHRRAVCVKLGPPKKAHGSEHRRWRGWKISAVHKRFAQSLRPEVDPWGLCPFCDLREPEDSIHFALVCPAFADLRHSMLLCLVENHWVESLGTDSSKATTTLDTLRCTLREFRSKGRQLATAAPAGLDPLSSEYREWLFSRRAWTLRMYQLLCAGITPLTFARLDGGAGDASPSARRGLGNHGSPQSQSPSPPPTDNNTYPPRVHKLPKSILGRSKWHSACGETPVLFTTLFLVAALRRREQLLSALFPPPGVMSDCGHVAIVANPPSPG